MRRGELIGLSWRDISLDGLFLEVNNAAIYIKGQGIVLSNVKTQTSRRHISFSKEVGELLSSLKKEQEKEKARLGTDWIDTDAVFTQYNGQRIHLDTPRNRMAKLLKKNNLPNLSPHGLRHLGASILIAHGQDIKTVQHRLGHSRASTTMDVYAHVFNHKDKEASDMLEKILVQSKNESK